MDFFNLIKNDVDIAPLLKEIENNEEVWLADTGRQDSVEVQRETQTINLRKPVDRDDLHINENQESEWTETSARFPLACALMENYAKNIDGTLSRAVIVRLKPKGVVYLHIDHGSYYFLRDRHHLVLKSAKGSLMMSGGEKVLMKEGELWWFENNQHHQAMNNSDEWRIHYIFDILPNKYKDIAKNPLSPNEISLKLKPVTKT